MTFGLFTHIAPGGLSRTYSHKCPFQPVGEVTTGPSNIWFFSHPIRRDLFPNTIALSNEFSIDEYDYNEDLTYE